LAEGGEVTHYEVLGAMTKKLVKAKTILEEEKSSTFY